MYTIQANPSGTRSIEVSNENLRTIEKYALFRHLIDSTGIVDEAVLDKLKLNIRSLIASQEEDSKDLLDLCIDVIYHNNMKAFGLQQLIKLYLTWLSNTEAEEEEYDIPVKTKTIAAERMDLEEAIMQMELSNHDFYIYTDDESGKISVVYRRNNGGYGLIETE